MEPVQVRAMRMPRERRRFITFAWKVYRNDSNWVPPLIGQRMGFLNPAKNPYYRHADVELLGAFRADDMVGTVAAHVNHEHNRHHKAKVGCFGFFECMNDPDVAAALFDAAGDWLRHRGMEIMRGPMSFSTHGEFGLQIEEFNSPGVLLLPHNPLYYQDLIEWYGFSKAIDLYSYEAPEGGPTDALVQAVESVARDPDIRIRRPTMKRYDEEVRHLQRLYNSSYSSNWGFTPLTDDLATYMAKILKPLIEPDVSFLAEVKDEVVGFGVTLRDYSALLRQMNGRFFPFGWMKFLRSKKSIDSLLLLLIGLSPEHRHKHIAALMLFRGWQALLDKGYKRIRTGLIFENNELMRRHFEWIGSTVYRTYRIYEKEL
jgi:hypothetical protein